MSDLLQGVTGGSGRVVKGVADMIDLRPMTATDWKVHKVTNGGFINERTGDS